MSSSHRKIFVKQLPIYTQSNPSQQSSVLKSFSVQIPSCYYHQQQLITHFCSSTSCTLPLCKKCKQIHLKQKKFHNIIPFEDAKNQALRDLKNRQENIFNFNKNLLKELQQYKMLLISQIDKNIQDIFHKFKVDDKLFQFDSKIDKIENGSIKSIIQHYSNQNYQKQINFPKYQLETAIPKEQIRNITSKCLNIQIKNYKKINQASFQSLKLPSKERLIISSDLNRLNLNHQQNTNQTEQHLQISTQPQRQRNNKFDSPNNKQYKNLSNSKQKKFKGISVYGSQKGSVKGVSPKCSNINYSQSLKKIPTPMISPAHSANHGELRDWKRVINMKSSHSSSSRLLLQNQKNNPIAVRLSNNNDAFLTPNQLRQICKNKTNAKKENNVIKSINNSKRQCQLYIRRDKQNINGSPFLKMHNSQNKVLIGSSNTKHLYLNTSLNKNIPNLNNGVKQFRF